MAWDSIHGSDFVKRIMSFRRFRDILECWHWYNAENMRLAERAAKNKEDPFSSIEPFLEMLSNNFTGAFTCGQKIDVDESCFSFKGRHRARCFNAKKPAKYHLKAYCLNDASTGYLHSFFMYRGKDEKRPNSWSATEYPVLRLLVELFWNKGYILCLDWYTSLSLVIRLIQLGIDVVGTVRLNKKNLP